MRDDSPSLTDSSGSLPRLDEERALLETLGRLAANLPADAWAIGVPTPTPAALLSDPSAAALLAAAGTAPAAVPDLLDRGKGRFADFPGDGGRLLLFRPTDLDSELGSQLPRRIQWRPFDLSIGPREIPSGSLGLRLAGSSLLTLEVNPDLPEGVPTPKDDASLAVSLDGRIGGGAGIGFPIRLGRADAAVAGRRGLVLRWLYAVPRGQPIAASAAQALADLPNPFDLDDMSRALGAGALLAVTLEADGEISLAGQLAVGLAAEAARAADAHAGLDVRFHWRHAGRFRFSVRPGPEPASVLVALSLAQARERGATVRAGISVEIGDALEGLKPGLLARTGTARALLSEFADFLPPSRYLSARIEEILAERLAHGPSGAELGEGVAGLVGGSPEAPDRKRLVETLAAAVDTLEGIWDQDSTELARAAFAGLLERRDRNRPAGGDLGPENNPARRSAVRALLEPALGQLIEELKNGLAAEVQRRLADPALTRRLIECIEPVVGGPVRTRDALARVRGTLADVHRRLAPLSAALQRSAEIKLEAGWHREERLADSSALRQSILFRPRRGPRETSLGGTHGASTRLDPDPSHLYRQALAGCLDGVFEAAPGPDRADPAAPVRLLEGGLQRVAGLDRSEGFALALLDIQLERTDLLATEVEVDTDIAGNIQVRARSESQSRRAGFGERRVFRCVNVYELATARATRRMTLAMSLDHEDDDLHRRELDAFFRGLADPRVGLIADQARIAALRAFDTSGGGGRVGGDLRFWLELDDAGMRHLLQIDESPGARSRPFDRRLVYAAAIDALLAGLAVTGSGATNNNLEHFVATRTDTKDLRRVLLDLDDEASRRALAPHPAEADTLVGAGADFARLIRISDRARGLAEALEWMRDLFLGDPARGPEAYREAQRAIDARLRPWAKGEPADRGLLSMIRGDTVGPYLLAFFKVIGELAQCTTRQPLNASLLLRNEGREREIRLAPAAFLAPTAASDSPKPSVPFPLSGPDLLGIDARPNPQARTAPMVDFVFPLQRRPALDFESGGRNFGARRDGGKRRHAGCDLKMPPGTPVVAMADGTVSRGPYEFYSGTYALDVVHDPDQRVVRYGEIAKQLPAGVYQGARVKQGEVIAYVGRLRSGDSMLHLELYAGTRKGSLRQPGNPFGRRLDLLNPTRLLKEAPLVGEVRDALSSAAAKAQAPHPVASPPRGWVRVGPGLKLNLRESPGFAARAIGTLEDGAPLDVLRRVTGGPHPFGDRVSWLQVRALPDQTARQVEGYVIAHLVRLDGELEAAGDLPQPGRRGMVSVKRLAGPLKVRSAPRLDAEERPDRLQPGEVIEILEPEVQGDRYKWDRTDWVRIRRGTLEGYAAGFYIDLVEPPGAGVGETASLISDDEEDDWTRALRSASTTGASRESSGGLGGVVGVAASRLMAEQDLDEVKAIADRFASAAGRTGLPAALLAALASRESRCGKALQGDWGDRGNGFGIMQVDRRYHRILDRDPKGLAHIEQGAAIFNDNLSALAKKFPSWDKGTLLRAAAAAYNFGVGNVRTKEGIDLGTAHDDYGSDVIARAQFYLDHPDLEIFRR